MHNLEVRKSEGENTSFIHVIWTVGQLLYYVFMYVGVIFQRPVVNFRRSKRYKNSSAASVHIKQVIQTFHKWPGKQTTYLAKGWTKIITLGPFSYGFYDSVFKIWYDNSARKAVHIPMTNVLPSNTSNPCIQELTRCYIHS